MEQFLVSQQVPKNKASDLKGIADNKKKRKKKTNVVNKNMAYITFLCVLAELYSQ